MGCAGNGRFAPVIPCGCSESFPLGRVPFPSHVTLLCVPDRRSAQQVMHVQAPALLERPSPSQSAFPASTSLGSPRTAHTHSSQGKELQQPPGSLAEPGGLSVLSSSVTQVQLPQRKAPGYPTASALNAASSTGIIQPLLGFQPCDFSAWI